MPYSLTSLTNSILRPDDFEPPDDVVEPIDAGEPNIVVCLVIDENGALGDADRQQHETVRRNQGLVVDACALAGHPVVLVSFIMHGKIYERFDDGDIDDEQYAEEILEPLRRRAHPYKRMIKSEVDAFSNADLEPYLRQVGARTLVIIGQSTNACVMATAMSATMQGFDVWTSMHALRTPLAGPSQPTWTAFGKVTFHTTL